ncbi:carboxypeptidase-like regulatory domain-containing protein [Lewinella sp. W8]|uniref:carboxypeptidase-like regulatory domain-containing protein n=1 Tax=Lewinella sp. W8 TaxID=2528208 RepID=UPI00106743E2|nr:carboxypeptidase-like regulatory domain-containing protein [Lewinella sp. W8]MTB50300.1 T9SS type A sorting domain-containing protein [Lewinella sp. W8]
MPTLLRFLCFSLLLGTCAPSPAFAQTDDSPTPNTFSGCIQEESGEPLIGASIVVKGTTTGTVTDMEGCFSLEYPGETVTLEIHYTGYRTFTIECTAGEKQTYTMEAEVETLEEVVVVGYGVSRKRSVSAAAVSMPASSVARESAPSHRAYEDAAADTESVSVPAADRPAAGQLTAGEVNDFGKWEMWHDISQEDLAEHRAVWQLYPDHRYPVQLTYDNGSPAMDVPVGLYTASGQLIWETRTDNHGRAELWRGLLDQNKYEQDRLEIRAVVNGRELRFPTAHPVKSGFNSLALKQPCYRNAAVDVALVVDATGSMGDEIAYLSSELEDVVRRSADSLAGADLRFGSVFYRDEGDDYLTRHADFTDDVEKAVSFVQEQSAGGGGDTPEAVDAALGVALDSLSWSDEAAARILFLVLDAPPHSSDQHVARMKKLTQRAARMGVRIIPVVCSGMDKSGEYLLRSMALATNGTYTFLTDHSGIGGKHLEPSTDIYKVELLNDLLVRLIHQFGRTQPCQNVDPLPVAEIEKEESTSFRAYPNPTAGPVTMNLPGKKGHVDLIDLQGKIIRRYAVSARRMDINLAALATGTYILRHTSRKGVLSSRRIIVDRHLAR